MTCHAHKTVWVGLFAAMLIAPQTQAADYEHTLATRLRTRGLTLGFDRKSERFVAVGVGKLQMSANGENGSADALVHCRKMAELSAKARILSFLRARTNGERQTSFSDDGLVGCRDVESAMALFASGVLTGESVEETIEDLGGNLCVVAVAISWSPSSAKRWSMSLAGERKPSVSWREELETYMREHDTSTWRTCEGFVDSEGTVHPLGIGRYEERTDALLNETERGVAVAVARKNLLLAIYGNSLVCEAARKKRRERHLKISDGGREVRVWEEEDLASLAEVEWHGAPPAGVRLLCEKTVKSSHEGRRDVVVVFGIEGAVAGIECDNQEEKCQGERRADSNVMVYNPTTGRFEREEGSDDAK